MDQFQEPLAIVAKYQQIAPVDLEAIAQDLGIALRKQSLGSEIAGQIVRDSWRNGNTGRSGFIIYVNSDQHPNRQRFTLAHEISHYILHRDLIEDGLIDDTMYRSSLSNFYETQANRMAADILMPIRLIKRHRPGKTPLELAKLFGVSEAAMKIRLANIKS